MKNSFRQPALVGVATILIMNTIVVSQTSTPPTAVKQSKVAQSPGARSSSDQARRGRKQYAENCLMCHAEDLKGLDPAPALTGDRFMQKWQGHTVWELFEKTRKTMPQNDRGGLSPKTYLDIVVYLAKFNDIDIGNRELRNDPKLLKSITIGKPKGAQAAVQ
jgi:cytochrome c